MGLLDKLWDDTVAGPQPDSGLGKLRQLSAFNPPRIDTSSRGMQEVATEPGSWKAGGLGEDSPDEMTPHVTRRIMIKRPAGSPSATPPESPAGMSPPLSPFYGAGGRRDWHRFRRKSTSDAYDRGVAAGSGGSTTPTTPSAEASSASMMSCSPFEV